MFARTAKFLTFERPHTVRGQVGQTLSKIRELDRLNAAPRRRRPLLRCCWQLDPASGRPVCSWEVESPERGIDSGRPDAGADALLCIAVLRPGAAASGMFDYVRPRRRT
jgi:hypothetical protein